MIQMLIVILDCNIVEFKILKLIVNCFPLVSFELRIRKKSSSGGILCINAKLHGGICKTWCWLTKKFDGGDKLINAVQF